MSKEGNQNTESQSVQESKVYDKDYLDSPNDEGLYVWNGMTFKYKFWVTSDMSYVVIANRKDVTEVDILKQMANTADTSFYVTEMLNAKVSCEIDSAGRYLYNGKAYKKVKEFVEETSAGKYVHIVLTNDDNITLQDVINSDSKQADRFAVIQKEKK